MKMSDLIEMNTYETIVESSVSIYLRSICKPISVFREEAKQKRRKMILEALIEDTETQFYEREISEIYSSNGNLDEDFESTLCVPKLSSLLCNDYCDERGPETPIDAFGRTALIAMCDPDFWSKLNERQMNNLHRIENFADIVYARSSWETRDKRGLSANDVCPDHIREIFDVFYKMRKENE